MITVNYEIVVLLKDGAEAPQRDKLLALLAQAVIDPKSPIEDYTVLGPRQFRGVQ